MNDSLFYFCLFILATVVVLEVVRARNDFRKK